MIISAETQRSYQAEVSVAFNNDCDELLIANISKAKKTIYGAIYSFTNKDIAKALIKQVGQKVKIYLKMDKEQAKFSYTKVLITMMREAGIEIIMIAMKKTDHMHHKFAVIDKQMVITGSFNWTRNAARDNYENIISIQSTEIADKYIDAWKELK